MDEKNKILKTDNHEKKLIRLFIAVGLVLEVGSCADVTDTPEYYGVYKEANIEI